MLSAIKKDVYDLKNFMIDLRRHFHRHPELGMQELQTAQKIAEMMKEFGLEVSTEIGKTGVVGLLKGENPGKTLMLRADMDALPIKEENNTSYKSMNNGVMHACGHDGHMAILLSIAKVLSHYRKELKGCIKFVFQPGEEGFGGAKFMIEDGVLLNPPVDAALALHLMMHLPVGSLGVCSGPVMASMDSFTLTIYGKGGHAAMPQEGADAILMSAEAISALQTLISKEISPMIPLVVHVGTIHGGNAFNIVADQVELQGTVRTLDENVRETIPKRIERITGGVTSALRGKHKLDYQFCYPPVVNHSIMTELVTGVATQLLGKNEVYRSQPLMGSDDMAFFLKEVPGCYFFIGAKNDQRSLNCPLHNSMFDFDEDALLIGAEVLASAAYIYLNNKV